VGLAQEIGGVDLMVADHAEQGGAVALPVAERAAFTASRLAGVTPSPSTRAIYVFMLALMAGKIACEASCRVLSRSNSQTGLEGVGTGSRKLGDIDNVVLAKAGTHAELTSDVQHGSPFSRG
jgi:hypothetical protein